MICWVLVHRPSHASMSDMMGMVVGVAVVVVVALMIMATAVWKRL